MKILHTSDWHLGRTLYGRKRYDEFSKFLTWLAGVIEDEAVDLLLVAGDIFDTSTPSNRAQELYYRFLCRVAASTCRHIVIIAGNHDSPTFLSAPRELLKTMNVHVVGNMAGDLAEEVLLLRDDHDLPQAIICAVPYLRDRDIRNVAAGESLEEKNAKLVLGLKNHYQAVAGLAQEKQAELSRDGHPKVPIIGMGHLFTSGGKTVADDGVRSLYVGNLAHIDQDLFPACLDYLALGHLHVPQLVGGKEHIRYCGSAIPMGYGEALQDKKVIMVDFDGADPVVKELIIPCSQDLERITGTIDVILARLEQLQHENSRAWLEIEYTGDDLVGNLSELLDEALIDSAMEIRRIKNRRLIERVIKGAKEDETLDDLNVSDVFERCLDSFAVLPEERQELRTSYNEILQELQEEDKNAE